MKFKMKVSNKHLACTYPNGNVAVNRDAKPFIAELILHELNEYAIATTVWDCELDFPFKSLKKIAHNMNAESLGEYEYLRADLANKYIVSDRLSDISGNLEEREIFRVELDMLRKKLYRCLK